MKKMNMVKNKYIVPEVVVRNMEIECMLSVSAGGSLDGTGTGGSGSGLEADTNVRNEWDEGLW